MSLSKTLCQKVWAEDWWSAAGHTGFSLHTAKICTYTYMKKMFLGLDFHLWLTVRLITGVSCQAQQEQIELSTSCFSQDLSAQPAPCNQHTETGLPVQVEEASIWLYLLTEMVCRSLVPHLHTHTHTHASVSGGSSWPSSLTSKAG